jgi:hypothetical protein
VPAFLAESDHNQRVLPEKKKISLNLPIKTYFSGPKIEEENSAGKI